MVGKDNLHLCAAVFDQLLIIGHIVNACELMLIFTEQTAVFLQGKDITIGIDACLVDLIQADQLIADLIRRIRKHQDDFLRAFRDAAQADGETVAGKNREDHADGAASQLVPDILRDGIYCHIVALGSGYYGFRDGNDVTVPDLKAFIFRSFQNAVRYDFGQIIPFPDNRAADASGYGTDTAFSLFIRHMSSLLLYYAYLTSGRWPGQPDFIIADEGQCIHSFFIPSARPVPFSAKKYSPRQTCLTIKRRHYYSNDVRQEKKSPRQSCMNCHGECGSFSNIILK